MKSVAVQYKNEIASTMTVDWYIGKRCNFCCSYCADFLHDNYSQHVTLEQMKLFVDRIVSRYGTDITWSITGGEPTLNPDLLNILSYIQDKQRDISICTNGSRTIDYLKQLFTLSGTIVFSLHFEHIAETQETLEEYVNKIIELERWRLEYNSGIPEQDKGWEPGKTAPRRLIARVMARPGYERQIMWATERLKSANIEQLEHRVVRPQSENTVNKLKQKTETGKYRFKDKPESQQLSEKTKVYSSTSNSPSIQKQTIEREQKWYTDDNKRILNKEYGEVKKNRRWLLLYQINDDDEIIKTEHHYNKLNFEGKTNFYGWRCMAGISLIRIAPNGDIFIANCGQGGSIGNIYRNEFNPPTEPVACEKFRCIDPIDLRQRKYISDQYRDVFDLDIKITENDNE